MAARVTGLWAGIELRRVARVRALARDAEERVRAVVEGRARRVGCLAATSFDFALGRTEALEAATFARVGRFVPALCGADAAALRRGALTGFLGLRRPASAAALRTVSFFAGATLLPATDRFAVALRFAVFGRFAATARAVARALGATEAPRCNAEDRFPPPDRVVVDIDRPGCLLGRVFAVARGFEAARAFVVVPAWEAGRAFVVVPCFEAVRGFDAARAFEPAPVFTERAEGFDAFALPPPVAARTACAIAAANPDPFFAEAFTIGTRSFTRSQYAV